MVAWGAIASAGLGLASLFGGRKKKKKPREPKRVSTFDADQQGLYKDYISSIRGQGPFADLYKYDSEQANQVFDQTVARPAYRGFQENVIPNITGQFRQQNLQNSSYTGEALSRAGRDVQENLDAQRASTQFQGQQNAQSARQNAINSVLNMQTHAYQRPQERQERHGVLDQILNSVGPAAADYFANYLRGKK